MSPADAVGVCQPDVTESREETPRRKAVLFCQDCGHESPVTGDWRVRTDYASGTRTVVCPECGTVLTDRPLESHAQWNDVTAGDDRHEPPREPDSRSNAADTAPFVSVLGEQVAAWTELWSASVRNAIGLSGRANC